MITVPSAITLAESPVAPLANEDQMLAGAELLQAELIELRRAFHAHPELSFKEEQTSERCAEYLTHCGFKVTRGLAGTGLIADFGQGQRTIAIRADMDALPISENNHVNYRSQVPGVMHACGHDAHMACALGAAKLLSTRLRYGHGRVRIIMQPGEEAERLELSKGSESMIEAGALKQVTAILGFHVDSTMQLGQAAILKEAASSFRTPFELSMKPGDKDIPLLQLTSDILQLLYKGTNELAAGGARVQLQSVSADDRTKLATICGAIDYTSLQAIQDIKRAIQTLCSTLAPAELFHLSLDPAAGLLDNHQVVIHQLQAAASEVLGANCVTMTARRTWTTHFADYTKHVPGAFFMLGTQISRSLRTMHSSSFDIDERVLPFGAAILAEATLGLLERMT